MSRHRRQQRRRMRKNLKAMREWESMIGGFIISTPMRRGAKSTIRYYENGKLGEPHEIDNIYGL